MIAHDKRNRYTSILSGTGLLAVSVVYVVWVLNTTVTNKAGYVVSFVSAALFCFLGLRFIPRWLSFWSGDECSQNNPLSAPGRAEAIIFLAFLLFDLFILVLLHFLRRLLGDTTNILQSQNFWLHIDSGYYLDIAESWYPAPGDVAEKRLVFFPGYPMFIKLAHTLIGNWLFSALTVSALCYASGAVVLYRLLCLDFTQGEALRALKYFAVLPAAFFFASPMTESLFFLCSVLCIYLCRRDKWLIGCLVGAYAAFTRSMGVMVFAAVFFEAVSGCIREKGNAKKWLPRFLCLFLIPLGIIAYFIINIQVTGSPFTFMELQGKYWGQGFGWFFATAARQIDDGLAMLFTPYYATALGLQLPNVAYGLCTLLLLGFTARKLRPSYTAWFIAYYVMSMGAANLVSGPRYLVALVPIYPALAEFSKNKKAEAFFSILCLIFSAYYFLAFILRWDVF